MKPRMVCTKFDRQGGFSFPLPETFYFTNINRGSFQCHRNVHAQGTEMINNIEKYNRTFLAGHEVHRIDHLDSFMPNLFVFRG